MTTRRICLVAAVIGIGLLSGMAFYVGAFARTDGWRDIAWPYPRDGWPPGRAYRCAAASCGSAVEIYMRPKIGFCNCDSGVADDDEVDRVADLDLISAKFRPLQPGQVVRFADMTGRSRQYELHMADGSQRQAVGMAVSRRCDLMVAVAQGTIGAEALQRTMLAFLSSHAASDWIRSAMRGG